MIAISSVVVSSPPWVDLYVSSLPATTTYVHVTRTWRGVSERVRGDSAAMILGADVRLVDWAAPVDTGAASILYRVDAYSAAGVLLESASTSITATTIDHNHAWLSDPHDPLGAVLVLVLKGDPSQDRSAPGAEVVATMTGRPLGLTTPRSMWSRSWRLLTETEDAEALASKAFGSSTVLLRGAPECLDDPTGVVYVAAESLSRSRRMPHLPDVTWSFQGIATRGPQAPPALSGRTYQDDLDEYPTYQDSLDAQPTYLDRLRG